MTPLVAIFGLEWPEATILGIIAVVLFARKLPAVVRSLRESVTAFKEGMRGGKDMDGRNGSAQ
jgi:Sec-independent protein translocase protein TatA